MLSLEKQASVLKDYLLFDRSVFYLDSYQQERSKFLTSLEKIKQLIPESQKTEVVGRRYQFLVRLANKIVQDQNYSPWQI